MNPSRYMLVNEKSPYPVKRRVRGHRKDGGNEPAITVLPPDPRIIADRPDLRWTTSPRVYRMVGPKSAKNREASSFVILGETMRSIVASRPSTPSGKISPFRGHGFKTPTSTRPNSRATSASGSPKRVIPSGKGTRKRGKSATGIRDESDASQDGSGAKSTAKDVKTESSEMTTMPDSSTASAKANGEKGTEESKKASDEAEVENVDETGKGSGSKGEKKIDEEMVSGEGGGGSRKEKKEPDPREKIKRASDLAESSNEKGTDEISGKRMPAGNKNENAKKLPSVSPALRKKTKTEKTASDSRQKEKVPKKLGKPPVPPRKIGTKMNLKNTKDGDEARPKGGGVDEKATDSKKDDSETKGKTRENNRNAKPNDESPEIASSRNNESNDVIVTKEEDEGKKKTMDAIKEVEEKKMEGPGKLVPCYQPDKCQIAPLTMASASPAIATTSVGIPPTSGDLVALGPEKNPKSISAAPTKVVPSYSMGSLSSTLVLSENLARKEIGKVRESKSNGSRAEVEPDANLADRQTVEAERKKDSKKEKSSGEIASATKFIEGEPEMEVLSPNNLRDSPLRMPPPPNLAWEEEERVPNGDVPVRPPKVGKCRRFLSAVWGFFGYFFCCRCFKSSNCCKKKNENSKPSLLSKLNCCGKDKCKSCCNCFSCCGNLFKCLTCKCSKPKCCQGSSKCCRGKQKQKPKPKKKSTRKCCAKPICNCADCCGSLREKINDFCRCLFCINLKCCQNLLGKYKCCHKLNCCQSNGCCSCCNPKTDPKLTKKSSRGSNQYKKKDQLDVVLVEHASKMKAAIPVLPSCLAIFCLIFNIFVPGLGTIISGILCLCFGKPRFSTQDIAKNRCKSFVINLIIGIAQMFTVIFCLVGWGWSIWWGLIMYKLSRRQKRLKLAEKNQQEAGSENVNHNHVDVEQG